MEEAACIYKNIICFLLEILYLKERMEDVTFQHGSEKEIKKSITNKILHLPDNTMIYPGHGEASMISEERLLYE